MRKRPIITVATIAVKCPECGEWMREFADFRSRA